MEGTGPFNVISWRPLPSALCVCEGTSTEAELVWFQCVALLESAQIRKRGPACLGGRSTAEQLQCLGETHTSQWVTCDRSLAIYVSKKPSRWLLSTLKSGKYWPTLGSLKRKWPNRGYKKKKSNIKVSVLKIIFIYSMFKISFSHIVYRPQYISVPVSSVTQSCPALRDPVDHRPPGSSVHRLPQARTLEWVANFLFQGIFPTQGSNPCLLWCLHRRQVLYHFATWEVP